MANNTDIAPGVPQPNIDIGTNISGTLCGLKKEPWGIHLMVQRLPSLEEMETLIQAHSQACRDYQARGEPWCSLLDMRGFPADFLDPTLMVERMRLSHRHGRTRLSIVVTDWESGRKLAQSAIDAATDSWTKVFVVEPLDFSERALDQALAWATRGHAAGFV